MERDKEFMVRALELARRAPFTSPNPRVGAVVVRDGKVLGEGFHRGAGTPHAEIVALDGIDARGATLYVSLEPCMHAGRTPPCAPAVAAAGVARVVVALIDPDRRVAGRGLEHLRANGIPVDVGLSADEARALNAPYLHQRTTGRSWLSLKLALSFDGRLAAADRTSRWITGEEARRRVHAHRLEADAVMVGSGTVAADDPQLTVRDVGAPRQPTRIVVDARGRVPATARVFDDEAPTIVATTDRAPHEIQTEWKEAGADVVVLPDDGDGVDVAALLDHTGARGFVEVLCEGGARLATHLLARDLVDGFEVHYGGGLIGATGVAVGDLGVHTIDDMGRWRAVSAEVAGADVIVALAKEQS